MDIRKPVRASNSPSVDFGSSIWNFQAQPYQSKAWRFIVMLFSFLNPDQAKDQAENNFRFSKPINRVYRQDRQVPPQAL
jgi:hypothetical protein